MCSRSELDRRRCDACSRYRSTVATDPRSVRSHIREADRSDSMTWHDLKRTWEKLGFGMAASIRCLHLRLERQFKKPRHGYGSLWLAEAVGRDPFAHAGILLSATERIVVATGIANIYARDPMTMVAGQRTLAEASCGGFVGTRQIRASSSPVLSASLFNLFVQSLSRTVIVKVHGIQPQLIRRITRNSNSRYWNFRHRQMGAPISRRRALASTRVMGYCA